jgi:hypothetical protein
MDEKPYWENDIRECRWCGKEFKPEGPFQEFCKAQCHWKYYNENGLSSERIKEVCDQLNKNPKWKATKHIQPCQGVTIYGVCCQYSDNPHDLKFAYTEAKIKRLWDIGPPDKKESKYILEDTEQ